MTNEEKYQFLTGFTKNEDVINELISYTKNKFIQNNNNSSLLEDTYLETWEAYYRESKEIGVFETLKKYLVQLQFPIQKGISKSEDYINVALRGKSKFNKSELKLNQPERIKLALYNNHIIGKVPIIIVPDNDDFNTIICALANKNEPKELPKSMGASFINGINNWDRIERLKIKWLKQNKYGNWSQYFKEQILPKPYLFKDKLIVLSTKNYSSVQNKALNISKETWNRSSLIIRREHECTHLFTLKHYGCMANNIHDEIIADYAGITKVLGRFNKKWFLHFMGLENYPNYRKGGRLENYTEPHQLSQEAFDSLKIIVKKVTDTIYEFDTILGKIESSEDQLNRIKSICEVDLISMASTKGTQKLVDTYNKRSVVLWS